MVKQSPVPFSAVASDMWPRGVVVSALTSHVRDPGFDSRAG